MRDPVWPLKEHRHTGSGARRLRVERVLVESGDQPRIASVALRIETNQRLRVAQSLAGGDAGTVQAQVQVQAQRLRPPVGASVGAPLCLAGGAGASQVRTRGFAFGAGWRRTHAGMTGIEQQLRMAAAAMLPSRPRRVLAQSRLPPATRPHGLSDHQRPRLLYAGTMRSLALSRSQLPLSGLIRPSARLESRLGASASGCNPCCRPALRHRVLETSPHVDRPAPCRARQDVQVCRGHSIASR